MSVMPPNNSPEWLTALIHKLDERNELTIRLDEKVGNGFANVNAKLDRMETRADKADARQDAHDARMDAFEIKIADRDELKARFFVTESKTDANTNDLSTLKSVVRWLGGIVTAVVITGITKLLGLV